MGPEYINIVSPPEKRRNPLLWIGVAVAAFILIILGVSIYFLTRPSSTPATPTDSQETTITPVALSSETIHAFDVFANYLLYDNPPSGAHFEPQSSMIMASAVRNAVFNANAEWSAAYFAQAQALLTDFSNRVTAELQGEDDASTERLLRLISSLPEALQTAANYVSITTPQFTGTETAEQISEAYQTLNSAKINAAYAPLEYCSKIYESIEEA